jgi:hypothetical protein
MSMALTSVQPYFSRIDSCDLILIKSQCTEGKNKTHHVFQSRDDGNDCLTEISKACSTDTISLLTVRRSYVAFASGKATPDDDDGFGKPVDASISMRVQGILADESFASARDIVKKVEQPTTAVLKCLSKELGLHKIKFRWVRHELKEQTRSI